MKSSAAADPYLISESSVRSICVVQVFVFDSVCCKIRSMSV